MKRHKFVRIPTRRETMATRRLRARLARERQGPDGKWETNGKKREVRIVNRKCAKLGSAFEAMRYRRLADEQAAMDGAKDLIVKLRRTSKASQLQELMPRLEGMVVTPRLFRQSPMLFDALAGAVKRCRRSKDSDISFLLSSWRKARQESKKRTPPLLTEDATTSDATSSGAMQDGRSMLGSAGTPRMMRPSRPQKVLPSMKLGHLFATMRKKQAAEEAQAAETAKQLMIELDDCSKVSSLRVLMPRLEGLAVTPGLLRRSPSILHALTSTAKRCRIGKDKSVSKLLSKWSEMRKQQVEQPAALHALGKADASTSLTQVKTLSPLKRKSTESDTPTPRAPFPAEPQPLLGSIQGALAKQSKITAFLSGGISLTTAGA